MKRYLCVLLLLVSSLSFALTPVTIDSASINYTAHTLSVVGSGFCTGDSARSHFQHDATYGDICVLVFRGRG